jgi:hypothetical protein
MLITFTVGEWIVRGEFFVSPLSVFGKHRSYYWAVIFLALYSIWGAARTRHMMHRRLAKPETQPGPARTRVLQAREFLGSTFALGIFMWGFVARIALKSSFVLCLPLYIAGLVLFAFFLVGDKNARREFDVLK